MLDRATAALARDEPDLAAIDRRELERLAGLSCALDDPAHRPDGPQAARLARRLMGCYRGRDFVDPETFAIGLAAALSRRHVAVCLIVVDPVSGIPSRLTFPPSLAEVRDALDAAEARIRAAGGAAVRVLTPRSLRSPEPTYSDEHRQAMRARWDELRGRLGMAGAR
jgi:hypothetical protein